MTYNVFGGTLNLNQSINHTSTSRTDRNRQVLTTVSTCVYVLSGVTKAGVARCGNLSPFLPQQSDDLVLVIVAKTDYLFHSSSYTITTRTALCFPAHDLFSVLVNSAAKNHFHSGVNPLDGVHCNRSNWHGLTRSAIREKFEQIREQQIGLK